MTPRRPRRAALAAAALSLLALTGCSAGGGTASPAASPAPSSSAASVLPLAAAPSSAAPAPASGPASASVAGDPATVVRVIDGDTVDVRRAGEGQVTRVRLLNVDTPETKHPDQPVQCMGPEATAFLESLLAVGDRVTLQYDRERVDPYGRTLAGVFEGRTLVNAEIARAGLGTPVVFEPNRRFHPEVLAAWEESKERGRGLNQPGLDCTLPPASSPTPSAPAAPTAPAEVSAEDAGAAAAPAAAAAAAAAAAPQAAAPQESGITEGSDETYYASCDEARAAGAAPLHRGSPGYRSGLDGDRDGVACEPVKAAGGGSGSGSGGGSTSGSGGSGSTSGSAGTSDKAPNRCYAPGGQTYVYCGEGGSDGGSASAGGGSGSGAAAGTSSGGGGPVSGSGGVCPAGYPVKVSGSGKYHLPGGGSYDKTGSKMCFASAAAAEAAGYVAAKG